jgi:hypothetical protein
LDAEIGLKVYGINNYRTLSKHETFKNQSVCAKRSLVHPHTFPICPKRSA